MKRLSDLPADDSLTSRAQALIRAMGPTVESEDRMRRVWRSLDASAPAAAPRWGWRVGLALGLLGVSAAAAAGSSAVSRVLGFEPAAADPAAEGTFPSEGKLSAPITAPVPVPRTRVIEAVPSPLSTPPTTPTPGSASMPASAPTPRAAVPALSEVARVHEAAKALRHDGDAERALQLLERGAPVTGPLAEEALALRIEASVTRGNGRQVKLATDYLARYPRGRYRELAKKALSESKP
jgi:hypothetical protein